MIAVTFRPLEPLERPEGPQRWSPFKASWASTLEILDRELRQLAAEQVVIQIAVRSETMIRRDGWPQERAVVEHPGVVVAFDSRHGPLHYETAEFHHWQDNLRAVALGLEALRKVDRYGITKSGEQYRGWRQLTAGSGPDAERGRRLIRQHGGYRQAVKATHPDTGTEASQADFLDIQAAHDAGQRHARAAVAGR